MNNIDFSKSKMYIIVKSSIDDGHVVLSAAHASLSGYLTFVESELGDLRKACSTDGTRMVTWPQGITTTTQRWAKESFRKVVCAVTDEQFEKAKTYGIAGKDFRVMTESAFPQVQQPDGSFAPYEVAIVFAPKIEWPPFFKSLPLWGKHRKVQHIEIEDACPCRVCGNAVNDDDYHTDGFCGSCGAKVAAIVGEDELGGMYGDKLDYLLAANFILRPCPFCGRPPLVHETQFGGAPNWMIRCCISETDAKDKEVVARSWNRRA